MLNLSSKILKFLARLLSSSLSKLITLQLVCRKRDVLASAVAIARAMPLYSARSGPGALLTPPPASSAPAPARRTLTVEISLAQDGNYAAFILI